MARVLHRRPGDPEVEDRQQRQHGVITMHLTLPVRIGLRACSLAAGAMCLAALSLTANGAPDARARLPEEIRGPLLSYQNNPAPQARKSLLKIIGLYEAAMDVEPSVRAWGLFLTYARPYALDFRQEMRLDAVRSLARCTKSSCGELRAPGCRLRSSGASELPAPPSSVQWAR